MVSVSVLMKIMSMSPKRKAHGSALEAGRAGKLADSGRTGQKNFVASPEGYSFFDSMAVEADGTVCVATIMNGGISALTLRAALFAMCRPAIR